MNFKIIVSILLSFSVVGCKQRENQANQLNDIVDERSSKLYWTAEKDGVLTVCSGECEAAVTAETTTALAKSLCSKNVVGIPGQDLEVGMKAEFERHRDKVASSEAWTAYLGVVFKSAARDVTPGLAEICSSKIPSTAILIANLMAENNRLKGENNLSNSRAKQIEQKIDYSKKYDGKSCFIEGTVVHKVRGSLFSPGLKNKTESIEKQKLKTPDSPNMVNALPVLCRDECDDILIYYKRYRSDSGSDKAFLGSDTHCTCSCEASGAAVTWYAEIVGRFEETNFYQKK